MPPPATTQAHYQLYYDLGDALLSLLISRDPNERTRGQAATRAEYANLTAALDHGLRTSQPIRPLIGALNQYLNQRQQHDARRQLLDTAIAAYDNPAEPQRQDELATLHDLAGNTALAQHRLEDAHAHYESSLHLLQHLNQRQPQAVTYHQLGMVAQHQQRQAPPPGSASC